MDATPSYRPRVSRETRLLLTTALVAAAALWVLARMRFPDLPANPNPVAPLLSPLAVPPNLDSLASAVFQLQARLGPSLVSVDTSADSPSDPTGPGTSRVPGLRIHDGVAVVVVSERSSEPLRTSGRAIAIDPPSGLAVVRVPSELPLSLVQPWIPTRLERPQFLMVTEASAERIFLRPVFVASLEPMANVLWPDPIWTIAPPGDIAAGSFVFTTAGEFVGAVIDYGSRRAIVPSSLLFTETTRLVEQPIVPAGDIGVRVQALTADVAAATGANRGVVVTWVDPTGPAAHILAPADVIEAVDGKVMPAPEHWRVHIARTGAGAVLTLRVRRQGKWRDVALATPASPTSAQPSERLGLRMQRAAGAGVRLIGVESGSVAARAGLVAGDVITLIGDVSSPTPEQVRAVFSKASSHEKPVLAAVRRGTTHFVMTLAR